MALPNHIYILVYNIQECDAHSKVIAHIKLFNRFFLNIEKSKLRLGLVASPLIILEGMRKCHCVMMRICAVVRQTLLMSELCIAHSV